MVFGRLKTELFYPRNWQATTIEQFIQVVDSLAAQQQDTLPVFSGVMMGFAVPLTVVTLVVVFRHPAKVSGPT